MDDYRELAERLREIGGTRQTTLLQGIVESVDGLTCSVSFGGITVDGIRLRASEAKNDSHVLVKPKIGTPVVVGSLSGDLRDLVLLAVDSVEEIEVHAARIVLNDGRLGGLVRIQELQDNLESLKEYCERLSNAVHAGLENVGVGTSANGGTGAAAFQTAMGESKILLKNMENKDILQ